MPSCVLLVLNVALLIASASCGGGDKHLPSINPLEYDPKKVYTAPSTPPSAPTASPTKPAEPEQPPIQLPSLEPGPNGKGGWKKVSFRPESLQMLKGVTTTCEVPSRMVQGLGSGQLFAGAEGPLKQSLGSQAESFARSLDQQLFDSFTGQLGPSAADCPSPASAHKSSSFEDSTYPARIVRTSGPSNGALCLV